MGKIHLHVLFMRLGSTERQIVGTVKERIMMYILTTLFLVSSVKFYLKRMCLLKS